MEPASKMRIPTEIFHFFSGPGGHSLIVRGSAGAGKTTFALQVIEDLAPVERGYYFSTRVSDNALLNHFPWLEQKLVGGGIKNGNNGNRSGLSRLKGLAIQPAIAPKKVMSVSIGRDLGDLEDLYQLVERSEGRVLITIDSVDALADRYGLTYASLISALQKDLVEGKGANLLYVLENSDQGLDYLGDGVVIVSRGEFNRRRVREIDILKLRGCEIAQPKYLFTLKGGRIQTFAYAPDQPSPAQAGWSSVQDNDGRVSSGLIDLDRVVSGGLPRGSTVLVELGQGVPSSVGAMLEQSLVANFVSQGRGVIWVPLRKASADAVRTHMINTLTKDQFERCVRIPEIASHVEVSAPYIMAVEGTDAGADLKWKNVSYSLSGAEAPYLSLLGFDTLESTYGPGVMEQLTEHIGMMKRQKGVCVAVTSPSSNSIRKLSDLANIHVKVERLGGTVVLYGEEPFTECNALAIEERGQGGRLSLTPIV
jgi:KaiC/GvpD/RAD55 family RecA-like ATPase